MDPAPVEFVIDHSVELGVGATSAIDWLVELDRLSQWLLMVDRVDVLDAGKPDGTGRTFRLVFAARRGGAGSFLGENVRVGVNELVRTYRMSATFDPASTYQRTVAYRLEGTAHVTVVHCRITTTIHGLHPRLAGRARASDEQSVDRSFERLRQLAGDGRLDRRTRWKANGSLSTPL